MSTITSVVFPTGKRFLFHQVRIFSVLIQCSDQPGNCGSVLNRDYGFASIDIERAGWSRWRLPPRLACSLACRRLGTVTLWKPAGTRRMGEFVLRIPTPVSRREM